MSDLHKFGSEQRLSRHPIRKTKVIQDRSNSGRLDKQAPSIHFKPGFIMAEGWQTFLSCFDSIRSFLTIYQPEES